MKVKFLFLWLMVLVSSCGTPEEKKMAFFAKGNDLFETKEYVKAKLEFKNAIQIDTKFAKAHYMLGKIELKLRDGEAAFQQMSAAVKLDPELIDARVFLGKIFLGGRILDRAGEQADEIVKLDPKNMDGLLLKASVYLAGKKYEDADRILGVIENLGEKPEQYFLVKASYYNAIKKKELVEKRSSGISGFSFLEYGFGKILWYAR